jgi:hypothetical protein
MNTSDITEIMRDIASETKNSVGDHWSTDWCDNAAEEIERLRKGTDIYILHLDTGIMFIGTFDECKSRKDEQPFPTDLWQISTISEYGQACYECGYDNANR